MNIDNLHDALSLLDDDLVEAVDELRSRKQKQRQRKARWLYPAAAACLCLVIAYGYRLVGIQLKGYHMADKEMAVEENTEKYPNKESLKDSNVSEDARTEQTKLAEESVFVKIISWQEDSFTGVITDNKNADHYTIGSEVIVKYTDEIKDVKDVRVGSIVRVQFDESTKNRNSDEKIIVYANSIQLIDTK